MENDCWSLKVILSHSVFPKCMHDCRLCLQEAQTSQAGEDSIEQTLDICVWGKGRVALMLTISHHVCGRDGWLPVKKQHAKQLSEATGNCQVAHPCALHLFHPVCPKIKEGFTILHGDQTNKTAETFYPLYCIWLLSQGLLSLSCPPGMAMWLVLTNEIRACPALKPNIFYLQPVRSRGPWDSRSRQSSQKLEGTLDPWVSTWRRATCQIWHPHWMGPRTNLTVC